MHKDGDETQAAQGAFLKEREVTSATSLDLWNRICGPITRKCNKRNGGRYRIRTCDFHRVNLA
jgi:hypothetical protein